MKRQYFEIRLNGAVVATTFAWNSAIRKIEKLVREHARLVAGAVAAVYKLVGSASVRDPDDKYSMLSGHRTWQSDTETLLYTITRLG